MNSQFGKLVTSIFILPLAAGNYRRRQNGSWYYDCTISSRVLFLAVLAIVIMFSATKSIRTHMDLRLGFVVIIMTALMVSGLIGTFIIGCLVRKQGLLSVVASRRSSNTTKLQVIFLWVFGVASGLYCAVLISKLIECSITNSGGLFWHTLLCFDILIVFCIFSQLIFITYFSSFKLQQTTMVNSVMLLLLAANMSVVLYMFVIDDTISYLINIDYDTNLSSCLKDNTTITFLRLKLRTFLRPTFVEYGLLSAAVILEIWSATEIPDMGSQNRELTALNHGLISVEYSMSENQGKRKVCKLIIIAASLTIGIGLVMCHVVMALDKHVGNLESVGYIAEIYEFTLKLLMIIAIFAGLLCLENYCTRDSPTKGLKPREYVYLLSAFGMVTTHMFYTVIGDVSSDHLASVYTSTNIISIFQDYVQVVFVMYANRCKKYDRQSKVAKVTVGQRNNHLWSLVRKNRLTASNFGLVLAAIRRNRFPPSLFKQILSSYNLSSKDAILWGINNESVAKAKYCSYGDAVIEETGIWLNESGILGASPDGIIRRSATYNYNQVPELNEVLESMGVKAEVIEVKCPFSARNMTIPEAISSVKGFCLDFQIHKGKPVYRLKEDHTYYDQVQGQLHILKKSTCDFVVWTTKDIAIVRVLQDAQWTQNMEKLLDFYFTRIIPIVQT